eukprot:286895_1
MGNKQASKPQTTNNDLSHTYSKLINMGYNESVSMEAARKYTKNINKAIDYIEKHENNKNNNTPNKLLYDKISMVISNTNNENKEDPIIKALLDEGYTIDEAKQAIKLSLTHNQTENEQKDEYWICSLCTFENIPYDKICEICGNQKVNDNTWSCGQCTFINKTERDFCEICGYNPNKNRNNT